MSLEGAATLARSTAPVADGDGTGTDWLTVDPLFGSVAPGASQIVSLNFDASGLAYGDYANNLMVASNAVLFAALAGWLPLFGFLPVFPALTVGIAACVLVSLATRPQPMELTEAAFGPSAS